MTPRNEFDGSEREALINKVSDFVEQLEPVENMPELTPPGNAELRGFREELLEVLEARQESNPMVTRAAVIDNIKKSLER